MSGISRDIIVWISCHSRASVNLSVHYAKCYKDRQIPRFAGGQSYLPNNGADKLQNLIVKGFPQQYLI